MKATGILGYLWAPYRYGTRSGSKIRLRATELRKAILLPLMNPSSGKREKEGEVEGKKKMHLQYLDFTLVVVTAMKSCTQPPHTASVSKATALSDHRLRSNLGVLG